MRALSRFTTLAVGGLLALGCNAPPEERPLLICHNSNCVEPPAPEEDDTLEALEASLALEDATGLPFVGAAGRYLDLLLACVDLSRKESVYICNVLKCRPPGNRNPLPDEIEACSPFLTKQLELVAPQALLAVGTFAAQALTGIQKPLGKLRGEVHAYQGIPHSLDLRRLHRERRGHPKGQHDPD